MTEVLPHAEERAREAERIGEEVSKLIPLVDGKPTDLGQAVFSLLCREIGAERGRAAEVVKTIAESANRAAAKARSVAHAAEVGRNAQLKAMATAMVQAATTLEESLRAAAAVIMLPPGVCITCRGTKLRRSPLNPNHMVACDDCTPKAAAAEPAP